MTMSDDYAILFVGANGCAPVIGFQGRLYGMTPLHVILTKLLVRIPVCREKRDRHAKSEKRREEEREEREERRLLVSVANVSTMFFLDWSYRRTGLRSWTAN